MKEAVRIAGYLMFRGGLLIAGCGTLVWFQHWVFALWIVPGAILWGLSLFSTGLLLVLVALALEHRRRPPPPADDEIGMIT